MGDTARDQHADRRFGRGGAHEARIGECSQNEQSGHGQQNAKRAHGWWYTTAQWCDMDPIPAPSTRPTPPMNPPPARAPSAGVAVELSETATAAAPSMAPNTPRVAAPIVAPRHALLAGLCRSEERRVGKECRDRREAMPCDKNKQQGTE